MTVANGCMWYVISNLALLFDHLTELLKFDLDVQKVKKSVGEWFTLKKNC